ncbi:MAG: 4Fe-4S binding protein, partial [Calditrichaeota bacterium]|nr:4Fe-4S binding protein [Calditrichota bacterium]
LERGADHVVSRPPGVESFLPISSLMSLKYWILTGKFNHVHPFGTLLFIIILATAFLLKRGFCSWVCPVGLFSEYLAKIHVLIFSRPRNLPRWLDYPLRSLKYLILFFFLWAVLVQMNVIDLQKFIYSPYNKVADIKMLLFFVNMSSFTVRVLIGLALFSILIRFFWCRYLCPYGALLGLTSWTSLFKIHRNPDTCIDCEECTQACPMNIKVHKEKIVISDECNACLRCVGACPVENTLIFSVTRTKARLQPVVYALVIVLLFLGGSVIARLTGVWQNNIPTQEYRYHIKHLNDPSYFHNRGQVPDYQSQSLGEKKVSSDSLAAHLKNRRSFN